MRKTSCKENAAFNTGQVTYPIRIDAVNLAELLKHPLWSPHERRGAFKLFDLRDGRLCGFLVCHCQEKTTQISGCAGGFVSLFSGVSLLHLCVYAQWEREREEKENVCIQRENEYVCLRWGVNLKEKYNPHLKSLQSNYNCEGCFIYIFVHSDWTQLQWMTLSTFNGGYKCTVTHCRARNTQLTGIR